MCMVDMPGRYFTFVYIFFTMKDNKKVYLLGISGFKGSGKTTLIEKLLPSLKQLNVKTAIIKHTSEPLAVDESGGDTARFYRAGADVLGFDGRCVFTKSRIEDDFGLNDARERLGGRYDLVLAEGFKNSSLEKIWLLRENDNHPPREIENIIKVLSWDDDRLRQVRLVIEAELGLV